MDVDTDIWIGELTASRVEQETEVMLFNQRHRLGMPFVATHELFALPQNRNLDDLNAGQVEGQFQRSRLLV